MKYNKKIMNRISAILGVVTGALMTLFFVILGIDTELFSFMFRGVWFIMLGLPFILGIVIIVIDAIRCAKGNKVLTITSIVINSIISILFISLFAQIKGADSLFILLILPLLTAIATIVCSSVALGKQSGGQHERQQINN